MSREMLAGQPGPIVLVCGADENYAMPLAVMLHSALTHLRSGSSVLLYVLDGGIRERSRSRLQKVIRRVTRVSVHVEWIRPDASSFSSLGRCKWISPAAYLRLTIPDVLPVEMEKAIYLDCDLIVGIDLAQLWEVELGERMALAVRDYGVPYVSSRYGIRHYAELGLPADQPYLNSGVLVINVKRWREGQVGEKVLEYLGAFHDDVQFADQDGLNVVLAGNWGMLDEKWNVSPRLWRLDPSKRTGRDAAFRKELQLIQSRLFSEPHVFHFCGAAKPWRTRGSDSRDRVHAAEVRWVHFLRQSGWRGPIASAVWFMAWKVGRFWLAAKVRTRPHRSELKRRMNKLVPLST